MLLPLITQLLYHAAFFQQEPVDEKGCPEAEFLSEIRTKVLGVFQQSPLQLCLEIYISSNSRKFFQFLQLSCCTL
jgi:hypothetical protein